LELKIYKIVFNYLYLYILQNIHNMEIITIVIRGKEFPCHDVVMTKELEELRDTHITQKETNWREWGPRKRKNDDETNETAKGKKRGFPGRTFPLNVLPGKQLETFLSEHQVVEADFVDFDDQFDLSQEVVYSITTEINVNRDNVLETVVIGDVDEE
jgi:hypothetical protein